MQLLMENVDMLQQDMYRLLGYEKNLAKQQQSKQQFIQRRVRGWRLVCYQAATLQADMVVWSCSLTTTGLVEWSGSLGILIP